MTLERVYPEDECPFEPGDEVLVIQQHWQGKECTAIPPGTYGVIHENRELLDQELVLVTWKKGEHMMSNFTQWAYGGVVHAALDEAEVEAAIESIRSTIEKEFRP